jgi:GT2 family glycosyltransferase
MEATSLSSVIIVSFRTPRLTEGAVRSALSASDRVVVIDNASGDETVPALRELGAPGLTLLENPTNLGFGAAANRGGFAATSESLIFLNSDAEISRSAVEFLVAELDRWNGRGIIGPRLVGTDGTIQRSAGVLPAPGDQIARAVGFHVIARVLGRVQLLGQLLVRSKVAREYATAETATRATDTSMVSGACFAIGRAAFIELGGFDERFFMYFEDADLCRRAKLAGMAVRYVPDAVVQHIGGASSSEDYHYGPHHARSLRQYMEKWYGQRGAMLVFTLLWIRAIWLSLALRREAPRARQALMAAMRA